MSRTWKDRPYRIRMNDPHEERRLYSPSPRVYSYTTNARDSEGRILRHPDHWEWVDMVKIRFMNLSTVSFTWAFAIKFTQDEWENHYDKGHNTWQLTHDYPQTKGFHSKKVKQYKEYRLVKGEPIKEIVTVREEEEPFYTLDYRNLNRPMKQSRGEFQRSARRVEKTSLRSATKAWNSLGEEPNVFEELSYKAETRPQRHLGWW